MPDMVDATSLERTLEAELQASPVVPVWIARQLATIYRMLERYDDEVALLERFHASQTCDRLRYRYEARLSKARALAERCRRTESVATSSIRSLARTFGMSG